VSKTYGELMEANITLTHEIISAGGRPPKVKLRSGNVAPLTYEDHKQIYNVLTETLAALKVS
jgi:hypothetical protein